MLFSWSGPYIRSERDSIAPYFVQLDKLVEMVYSGINILVLQESPRSFFRSSQ